MDYNFLPDTDIEVSKICLGTMTWGRQNSEAEGHAQMDYAVEHGVNFFDTAELYPVPPRKEEQGDTEKFIGTWFKKTGNRNYFGKRGHHYEKGEVWEENFELVLDALNSHVKAGNIRHVGLSNETPWGTMKYLQAQNENRPKMRTIQNPYSLLNRTFEVGNAEVCHRENVGLLAYSPLAFGVLSGKYRAGKRPENGRITLFPNYSRYSNAQCNQAVDLYHDLAIANGMTLTQMALSFVNDRPFVTSNIIGATSLEQLKENIGTASIKLSSEVLKVIDEIQELVPNPAP